MAIAAANHGRPSAARHTLYTYAHATLTRTLRDLVKLHEAASEQAVLHGYDLGPLFLEEDDSDRAMQALLEAVTRHTGTIAVAVPHRGHLIPLGGPTDWQQYLEDVTGHPLVFTSRTP